MLARWREISITLVYDNLAKVLIAEVTQLHAKFQHAAVF